MYDGNEDRGTGPKGIHIAFWAIVVVLILAIIAGGAVFISRNTGGGNSVEFILPSESSSSLEIYLSGAVESEGIYTFDEDSSLGDVLRGAGGLIDGMDTIKVKVRVLLADEDPFGGDRGDGEGVGTKINVNTASSEKLQTLSGIGPVKAQAIIDYRVENGLFRTVDDVINVSGIGPKTLEKIRDQITVVD